MLTTSTISLEQVWREAFAPPNRDPIWSWAARNLILPAALTRREFDWQSSRHFLAPLDAMADDAVREIPIRKPTRGGGTMLSDIFIAWSRANDPGSVLLVMQSDEMSRDHFISRLRPMMTDSPSAALRAALPSDRYAISNSEIRFADGLALYTTSGNSIASLQTRGVRYALLDECWLFKPGVIDECEARVGDFLKVGLSKLILTSQGSTEGDDFDRRWREASAEFWEVQCQSCGQYFQPRFKHDNAFGGQMRGLRWDEHKDERGLWNIPACLPSIRYECPGCGHPHLDTATVKAAWNETGRYIATNPNAPRSKRSFTWTGVIDWPWVQLVEFYLRSRNAYAIGLIDPLILFFQKYFAEPKSEATMIDERVTLKRQAVAVGEGEEKPEDFVRVLTADRQAEGLYWVVVAAISQAGQITVEWFGKVYGGVAIKAKADELTCDNVLIDAGFEAKVDGGVYSLCCKYHSETQRWLAAKGSGDRSFWHQTGKGRRVQRSYSTPSRGDPEQGRSGEGQRYATLIRFSSDTMNERLDGLITSGKFTVAETAGDLEEFKRHLASEYKKRKRDAFTGRTKFVWACPSGVNHLRDCGKMIVLCATMAEVLPDTDLEPA